MPLSALADRRRTATRAFEEALARAEAGRGRANERSALQRSALERGFEGTVQSVLGELGGRGLARGPRSAGRPVREFRDQLGADLGAVDFEHTEMLAALEAMTKDAEFQREREFSSIAAEEARIKAEQRRAKLAQRAARAQAQSQLSAIRSLADQQKAASSAGSTPTKKSSAPKSAPKKSTASSSAKTSSSGGGSTPKPRTPKRTAPSSNRSRIAAAQKSSPKLSGSRATVGRYF